MTNLVLYIVTVLVWGSSWIAIKFQLGDVPAQVSIAYRFFLSSLFLYVFCRLSGRQIRFRLRDHLYIFLQGLLLFSFNYFLIYWSSAHLTSGLVSVVFSLVVIFNIIGSRLFFGTPVTIRIALGAALGLSGIAAIFGPEIQTFDLSGGSVQGLLLGLGGTICASGGMLTSGELQKRKLPVIETTTLAMFYGAIVMAALNVAVGNSFVFDFSAPYILSLLFLTVFASIIGFGCYLTLLGRIGAARAGYATILFPVVALTLSTLFEGFAWSSESLVGVGLVLVGNVFILFKAASGMKSGHRNGRAKKLV